MILLIHLKAITNKHMVKDSIMLYLKFSLSREDEFLVGESRDVVINNLDKIIVYHPSPEVDLCCILIDDIINQNKLCNLFFKCFSKENIISTDYI